MALRTLQKTKGCEDNLAGRMNSAGADARVEKLVGMNDNHTALGPADGSSCSSNKRAEKP